MSPHFHELFVTYGYWLMTFGALIEGETFLVAGGIAAQQGMFHIPGLIALAVLGTMIHDGVFFYIGRYGGARFLLKKPQLEAKVHGFIALLDKYGVWLVLALRFCYGFRTIIGIAIGMSHMSQKKFWLFDFVGGVIWSTVFIMVGYIFGSAVTVALKKLHLFDGAEWKLLLALVVAVFLLSLVWMLLKKVISKKR